MNFKTSVDTNGNKTLKVKAKGKRGFSIQTLGNLPKTHLKGVFAETQNEVLYHVNTHGTKRQKDAVNNDIL